MSTDCGRRSFLRSALLGLLACGTGACRNSVPGLQPAEPPWLATLIHARESAVRLGRSYLENHSDERDAARLLAYLETAIVRHGGPVSQDSGAGQVAVALGEAIRDDYLQDKAVYVAGWLISRTEARMYALISMTPPASP